MQPKASFRPAVCCLVNRPLDLAEQFVDFLKINKDWRKDDIRRQPISVLPKGFVGLERYSYFASIFYLLIYRVEQPVTSTIFH